MSSPEVSTLSVAARKPSMFWTVVWGYGLMTIFIGFVLFFIGRQAFAFKDADAEREIERIKIRDEVAAASKKALEEGPNWINKEKGIVHLPIDQAMALTVDRLKIKKPRAANPIEAAVVPAAGVAPAAAAPVSAVVPAAPATPAPSPAAPPK